MVAKIQRVLKSFVERKTSTFSQNLDEGDARHSETHQLSRACTALKTSFTSA